MFYITSRTIYVGAQHPADSYLAREENDLMLKKFGNQKTNVCVWCAHASTALSVCASFVCELARHWKTEITVKYTGCKN